MPIALTSTTGGGGSVSGPITDTDLTMSTARLLGRTTGGTGDIEEISVGSGLTLSAGTLSASGGGGVDGTYTDIASASSVALGGIATVRGNITGTTTITAFTGGSAGTYKEGKFAGILTLTYNGTSMILPGAANITTAAGDTFGAVTNDGTNWRVVWYQRVDGTPLFVGSLTYPTNSGAMTFLDMPVTSGAADNTEESYAFKIDGQTIFKIYAQSDGAGSVDNGRVEVNGAPLLATAAAYGTGTVATLTNTAAALDFGTTDPLITINYPGTWKITACVQLAYTGATVVAETATLKLRRTNNTAADLTSGSITIDLPASTTLTQTFGVVQLPSVIYTTVNANDTLTIFGNVSATLGAGTITAEIGGTWIMAERLS